MEPLLSKSRALGIRLERFSLGCIPDCFPAHPERSRAGGEVEGARASTSLRYAQPERHRVLDSYK
jgi:hypothetical protein